MNRARYGIVLALAYVLIVALGSTLAGRQEVQAVPRSSPVEVVNTPLPVTGDVRLTGVPNVSVVNLPAVQSQQSGPWNVGILGTPTVNIGTLPSAPLQVAAPTDDPADAFAVTLQQLVNSPTTTVSLRHDVPAGKMLVIETITLQAQVAPGHDVTARMLAVDPSGNGLIYQLPMELEGTFLGGHLWKAVHDLRARAWPGNLFVQISRDPQVGNMIGDVTLSGYFVDL